MLDTEMIEKKLEYRFRDKSLLTIAMTHSSYANRYHTQSYDRLEFLGDSVLSLVTADYLYRTTSVDEGQLSKMRAAAVDMTALNEVMNQIGVLDDVMTSGTDCVGGKIPSDVVEALIGAIYIDGGFEAAKRFVTSRLSAHWSELIEGNGLPIDYKTELQEAVQAIYRSSQNSIRYEAEENCDPVRVRVIVCDKEIASGIGKSKRVAERNAAKNALAAFREKGTSEGETL